MTLGLYVVFLIQGFEAYLLTFGLDVILMTHGFAVFEALGSLDTDANVVFKIVFIFRTKSRFIDKLFAFSFPRDKEQMMCI
jgi:hypothetical protein